MKKVFIKYNPYKLETEVTIDGQALAENSRLHELVFQGTDNGEGVHFQDWVEELPHILLDECNVTDFEIKFHGTLLDYNDLVAIMTEAAENSELSATIERIPAKETTDKEKLIDKVVAKITSSDCPFDPEQVKELKDNFDKAKDSDFEVCVVATMSAGKSTLINAMLGTKLMPSAAEACTAIITRIKDVSQDNIPFRAEVYNKEGKHIESYDNLNLETMNRLNQDEQVSEIRIEGNIPFVTSDDVSLVLVDTPGPNNARNREHRKVQNAFLNQSSKTLVIYIVTSEFGTDDDKALIAKVVESMSKGGKQSKDRFLFVVNKLDNRKKEDGTMEATLGRIRGYLENPGTEDEPEPGIHNPNIFPAAALPAMNIRLMQSGEELDDDTIDDTETQIKKLNRDPQKHFETYASLPQSICKEIDEQLETAKEEAGDSLTNPDTALIHSGIVSIEAAIRQYVQKYAKTAKIRSLVATFKEKLAEWAYIEETKKEIADKIEEHKHILKQIALIESKIKDVKEGQKFKAEVDKSVDKVKTELSKTITEIRSKYQVHISKRIKEITDDLFTLSEAELEAVRLEKYARKLDIDFESELDELIRQTLITTNQELLQQYRKKLENLTEELKLDSSKHKLDLDPLKLIGASLTRDMDIKQISFDEKVKDGEEWVENTDKKWYKPWTWFQEKGYYRTKYKTVKRVKGEELGQNLFEPAEKALRQNGDAACKYAVEQSKKIAENFKKEFERLNQELLKKTSELKSCMGSKEDKEKEIKAANKKLDWLKKIQAEVESILEI